MGGNLDCNGSIGVFDSGIGGLTVLHHLIHAFPKENFIYFGDTARVPYGNKSEKTIRRYAIESTLLLLERNIKLLIVACHTASAYAIEELQRLFSIPVVGVIVPAVEEAIKATRTKEVLVLGTKATVSSKAYEKEVASHCSDVLLHTIACPLFVPLVEDPPKDLAILDLVIKEYLTPFLDLSIDVVIFGCTHYPLIKKAVAGFLPQKIKYIESGPSCISFVAALLKERELDYRGDRRQEVVYLASDDPERVRALGARFLGMNIQHVEVANVYSGTVY